MTFVKIIKKSDGMTFIELIVVLSIMSIIAGIMLFNYSSFATAVSLQNLTNDVALSITDAQKTAIYGRDMNSTVTIPAYGIHFDLSDAKSFYKFIDSNTGTSEDYFAVNTNGGVVGNYKMDSGNIATPDCVNGTEECLLKYTIKTGDTIAGFTSNDPNCSALASNPTSGYIDIAFKRPFPDPKIKFTDSTSSNTCKDLTIKLRSSQNLEKSITITPLGQVLVNE